MKQAVATKKMFAIAAVSGRIPVSVGKLLGSHPLMYAKSNERPKHISYWWPDHQIGVSLIVLKTAWRTDFAYIKPLDDQPIEYAVKVVQVLMMVNKIARETGGKEEVYFGR